MDAKATRPVIAGIGEILWDVLGQDEELGGAPINFAYHAGALGAESYAISCVGDDERGRNALAELRKRRMSTGCVCELPGAITGYVLATIDGAGSASYTFPDNVAWDRLTINERSWQLAPRLDAICFGSLAQRSAVSRNAIHHYLCQLEEGVLKVFDINLRQQFYTEEIIRDSLALADVVKLNDEEMVLLGAMLGLAGGEEEMLGRLVENYGLRLAVLTRGGKGSLLVSADQYANHRGYPAEIIDTIGAGDSFTATTVLGLLNGYSLARINEHANRVAAHVCSCQGAMPSLPAGLLEAPGP
ncbi:MAG: carbohydrate kinase family protein [Desulfopila sp.]